MQVVIAAIFAVYIVGNVGDGETQTVAVTTDPAAPGTAPTTGGTTGTPTTGTPATTGGAGTPSTTPGTTTTGTGGTSSPQTTPTATPNGDGATAAPDDTPTSGATDSPAAPTAPREGTRIGVTDSTVRVGTLVSQTGAINFRSSAQATKAYFDMINEAGGVHGRQIELLLRDDGLDPNRGQQAIEEMLNAGIFSFVAFNAPLTEGSVPPILEKNDINMIGSFAMRSSELSYRFGAGYQNFGKVGGTRLCENGVTTPGLVYISNQDEELDANIFETWRRGVEQCGLEISDDNLHPVDVTKADFTDVVTSLQFAGVDGVGTVLDATAMVRFQQAMNRQGYAPLQVALPFGSDSAVLNDPNVGDSFAGMEVLSDVHFPGTYGMVDYEAEVRRRFGDDAEINWAGAQGWVSAMIFVEALERTGPDLTREAFRIALDAIENFDTNIMFPHTFGEDILMHSPNTCVKVGLVQPDKTVREVQGFTCTSSDLDRY